MIILVANLGSTSFKYRLLDHANERELARGAIDRIGAGTGTCAVTAGEVTERRDAAIADHGEAVAICLRQLTDSKLGILSSADEIHAIGFKAVHGGRLSGAHRVTDKVLDAMAEMNAAAPAHNPPYIAAMKQLRQRYPEMPLVAAFETGFHQTIPESRSTYAIPSKWTRELRIRRYGFHGASHRWIGTRLAALIGAGGKVISCHLGGSSSVTAIDDGKSVMTSMGMTPQTGLPQNNRVGDFDPFAIPLIQAATAWDLDKVLAELSKSGGLAGISGRGGDLRDLHEAADAGDADCRLAIDVFVEEIRRYIGGCMVALGQVDAIAFAGGIGENDAKLRAAVCGGLENFGIVSRPDASPRPARQTTRDETSSVQSQSTLSGEFAFHDDVSKTQLWVIPTNEEWIVASQTVDVLTNAAEGT
ncbi:MAG: acetate/propionate family kinase [Planctomycetota bacterium]